MYPAVLRYLRTSLGILRAPTESFASLRSPFLIEVKSPSLRQDKSGRHLIKMKLASHELMTLRAEVRTRLRAVLDEAAASRQNMTGVPPGVTQYGLMSYHPATSLSK